MRRLARRLPGRRAGAPSRPSGGGQRLFAALVAVAASVAALAGCGATSGPSIVLYNGQHLQLTSALVAAFEKQTGITVLVQTDDSLVLADQILEQGSSSPADVYLSENSPELTTLQRHGLLARLRPAILAQVPARDNSPVGDWVAVALRVSCLVYDPALMRGLKLPRSILDLAQPQWRGKVAIAPIDSDFPPLVGAVIHAYGVAATTGWLEALKRNAESYPSDEAVVAAVNRGNVAVGVINQYYWYRLRLEVGAGAMHSALYYFPAGNVGSVVNISGAAVLASSTRRADAEKFVAFIVSAAGQRIIARSDDFEYPARPGVSPNGQLPPLEGIAHDALTPAQLGTDAEASQLLERVGLL